MSPRRRRLQPRTATARRGPGTARGRLDRRPALFRVQRQAAEPLDRRELAGALAGWLEAQELGPVCLAGCSFGCQIAADLAVRRPDLVSSLVLAGPTVDPDARTWPRLIGRWLRNAVHEDARMAPLNIADYRDARPRRVIAFREAIRDRIEDTLPDVSVPALVVRGERDRIGPQVWAEQVTRLLPYGRLAVVPGAPHMVPFRAPEELTALVTDFVQEAPSVVG